LSTMKHVLDTNIFNRLVDGRFSLSLLPEGSAFVATKIQYEELKQTRDLTRRIALIKTFESVAPELVPVLFALDVAGAGLGEGKLGHNGDAMRLRADLEATKPKFNNWHDALIAEVALTYKYTLITADKTLAEVAKLHGISVLYVY